ncbi:MAG: hypothetical protein U1F26_18065 [Lysobacterales bacterium]
MNRIDGLQYLWLRLRRVPRWAWISAALGMLLIPVLLIWMAFALLGVAWQGGSSLVQQGREWLGLSLPQEAQAQLEAALPDPKALIDQVVPDVQQKVQAQLEAAQAEIARARSGLQAALPTAEQGLAGAAAVLLVVRLCADESRDPGRISSRRKRQCCRAAAKLYRHEGPADLRAPARLCVARLCIAAYQCVFSAGPRRHGDRSPACRSASKPLLARQSPLRMAAFSPEHEASRSPVAFSLLAADRAQRERRRARVDFGRE